MCAVTSDTDDRMGELCLSQCPPPRRPARTPHGHIRYCARGGGGGGAPAGAGEQKLESKARERPEIKLEEGNSGANFAARASTAYLLAPRPQTRYAAGDRPAHFGDGAGEPVVPCDVPGTDTGTDRRIAPSPRNSLPACALASRETGGLVVGERPAPCPNAHRREADELRGMPPCEEE
mmetsp:Transcript_20319/g.67280  ORF Transcript_20319/g.67280 Transcript_20319/m.67280 type:complete len:178 (+) Transcript_20319:73-606(+)